MKNIITISFAFIFLGLANFASAATVCDDQAKPAFSCPTGYSVMCIPVGTPHWGCGKESNGQIVEVEPVRSAASLESEQSLQALTPTSTRPTGDPDFDLLKTTPTSTSPTPSGDPDFDLLKTAPTSTWPSGDPDFDLLKTAPPPPPPPPPAGLTGSDGGVGELSDKTIGDPDFDLLSIDVSGDDLERFRAEVSTADPIKKVTVRGWDPEKKEEILARPEDVKTSEDLKVYVEVVVLNDVAIKGIKIKENTVEVESRESGKLFWLIPVEMSSNVIVQYNLQDSTADRVKVRFPWWHIFVKKPYANGPSGIQIEISAGLNTAIWQKVDNSDIPIQMSRISQTLQIISNIMKTKHDTVKNSISNIR